MAEKLIIVDDSTTIQKVIRIAFSRYQVEIYTANSFADAASEISKIGAPSVLIIDASLLGPQRLADLKSLAGSAPVLLLIGSYDGIDEAAIASAGFQHTLKKPFESQDIVKSVTAMLGRPLNQLDGAHNEPEPGPAPAAPIEISYPEQTTNLPPIKSGGLNIDIKAPDLPPLPNQGAAGPDVVPPPDLGIPNLLEDEEALEKLPNLPPIPLSKPDVEVPPLPDIDQDRHGQKAFDEDEDGADLKQAIQGIKMMSPEPLKTPTRVKVPETKPVYSGTEQNQAGTEQNQAGTEQNQAGSEQTKESFEEFLRVEAPVLVRRAIEDYCQRNFESLAREILTNELRRLADEKTRLLVDS